MDRRELKALLDYEGVAEDSYTFTGGHPPETYVLSVVPGRWTVYYSERGLESGRREFDTEDAACEHLLGLLRRDDSVDYRLVIGPLPAEDADAEFQAWQERVSVTVSPADLRIDNPMFTTEKTRRYGVRTTVLRDLGSPAAGAVAGTERTYVPLLQSFLEGRSAPAVFHDRFLSCGVTTRLLRPHRPSNRRTDDLGGRL